MQLKSKLKPKLKPLASAMALLGASTAVQAENPIENVMVYGQSPLNFLSGLSVISPNEQTLDSEELGAENGVSMARLFDDQLVSVAINDVQNNPFQADLQYRGFTASPLLGLPQGLAVFFDGTRFNEPFGDTVNWDLIAPSALQSATLIGGSNPVFGQNAMGGALLLRSKNGFTHPYNKLTAQAGADGVRGLNAEAGDNNGDWGYYLNLNRYEENGWRRFSPSDVKQALLTLSHRTDQHESQVTLALNDNSLFGNGALPVELIPYEGRETVYTLADETTTQMTFVNLNHQWHIDDTMTLRGNVFYRRNEISTYNGDDSDYEECDAALGATLCDEEGEVVQLVGAAADAVIEQLSDVDPDELDGTVNRSLTTNDSFGFSGELSFENLWLGKPQHWIIGAGFDQAEIDFRSGTEFAILNNDTTADLRDAVGIGLYDVESQVLLSTDVEHTYVFVSNYIEVSAAWQVALAARYARAKIDMVDGIEEGEGSLNGNHQFTHFSPSITIHYSEGDVSWYGMLGESTRTPSPAELSCADPEDPCKLPNGFVADPPLDQVVTDTLEVGVSWVIPRGEVRMAAYRSDSHDDIIFQQAGGRPSEGYFTNVDKTRRQGLEFAVLQEWDDFEVSANASYLDATYQSPFTSFSPANPLGANRQVEVGDTIPGQPRWQAELELSYQIKESWQASVDIDYAGGQYFRGDEANENRQLPSYTTVNISSQYMAKNGVSIGFRLENLFDTEFETFGTYGEVDEVLGEIYPDIESTEFIGVGQPRTWRVFGSYRF